MIEPIDRKIRDYLCHVTRYRATSVLIEKIRTIVLPLPWQDIPIVEPGRVTYEVPLADNRCLISVGAQQFRERHLAAVESAVRVVVKTVLVAIFAGEYARPTRPTQRIRHITAIEPHPLV